jgi:hypothetical protein
MLYDTNIGQAVLVGVICQFKVMVMAMVMVSPRILLLSKPVSAN